MSSSSTTTPLERSPNHASCVVHGSERRPHPGETDEAAGLRSGPVCACIRCIFLSRIPLTHFAVFTWTLECFPAELDRRSRTALVCLPWTLQRPEPKNTVVSIECTRDLRPFCWMQMLKSKPLDCLSYTFGKQNSNIYLRLRPTPTEGTWTSRALLLKT